MIDIRRYKNTFANLNRGALFVRVSTCICLYVYCMFVYRNVLNIHEQQRELKFPS